MEKIFDISGYRVDSNPRTHEYEIEVVTPPEVCSTDASMYKCKGKVVLAPN